MVLIVDDHEDTRTIYARVLRSRGFAADTAPDGAAALAAMGARRPDVVLLDYNMPGMSGIDVLERMRATADLRDVPVVLFTGANADVFVDEARRLGVHRWLQKSVTSVDSLIACLRPFSEPAGA